MQVTTATVTAVFILLAIFNFSSGAGEKTGSKKQRGVTSLKALKQLANAPENENTALTVKGIYSGSKAGTVLLKAPEFDNKTQLSVSCEFAAGNEAGIKDLPLESEFVITGTLTTSNGMILLRNCRLISVNLPETATSL